MKKIKLLLLIPSISPGGAERVMVHLFNHISREKFEVYLAVLCIRETIVSNFREEIEHFHNLEVSRIRSSPLPLIKYISRLQPDVLFSALPAMNMIISLIKPFLPKKLKFIIRETSIPSVRNDKIPAFLHDYFYRNFLKKNDVIICQGKAMANDLIKNYNIPGSKVTTINNPIDFDQIKTLNHPVDHFDVLLVGGLRVVKGIHRLIKAAQFLAPDISIGIIGSGKEESALQQLVKVYALNQIKFLGYQSDPISYMRNSNVVVQTSYYEGFPNVLIESLAVGTPVVAFNVPGGTSEVINEGVNGFLVADNDFQGFAHAINKALTRTWDKDQIKEKTFRSFNMNHIIGQYEKTIEKTMTSK